MLSKKERKELRKKAKERKAAMDAAAGITSGEKAPPAPSPVAAGQKRSAERSAGSCEAKRRKGDADDNALAGHPVEDAAGPENGTDENKSKSKKKKNKKNKKKKQNQNKNGKTKEGAEGGEAGNDRAGAGDDENADERGGGGGGEPADSGDRDAESAHPFTTHPDDHCETPRAAYVHIAPLLSMAAERVGVADADLRVYDPYHCNGAMKRHLGSLGFPRVSNPNEDCYASREWADPSMHDVIVTNPPYSSEPHDHVEALLRMVAKHRVPFFLLMPNYVYRKDYYLPILREAGAHVFFLVPNKRYTYETPDHLRDGRSGAKKTSPFVSLWYCCMWDDNGVSAAKLRDLVQRRGHVAINPSNPDASHARSFGKTVAGAEWASDLSSPHGAAVYVPNAHKLPQTALDSWDPRRKRPRKKQREAAKRKAAAAAAQAGV